jgi:hypothetical protein
VKRKSSELDDDDDDKNGRKKKKAKICDEKVSIIVVHARYY